VESELKECFFCLINVTFFCIQLFQNHNEVFVFIILMTALPLFLLLIFLPTFFFLSIQYTLDMLMCIEFSVIHLTFNLSL